MDCLVRSPGHFPLPEACLIDLYLFGVLQQTANLWLEDVMYDWVPHAVAALPTRPQMVRHGGPLARVQLSHSWVRAARAWAGAMAG